MVEGSKSESGKRKQPIDGDTLTAKVNTVDDIASYLL